MDTFSSLQIPPPLPHGSLLLLLLLVTTGAVGTLYGDKVDEVKFKSDHVFVFDLVSEENIEKAKLFKAMSDKITK